MCVSMAIYIIKSDTRDDVRVLSHRFTADDIVILPLVLVYARVTATQGSDFIPD